MNLFKIAEETCAEGCPYYQAPATDFPKEERVHNCKLAYAYSKQLERLMNYCPLTSIETILEEYNEFKKNNENATISQYIERCLL